jgi:hypothetical protein
MCNLQHMKRFSVFLALPSATIRSMTSRACVVGGPAKFQHSSTCCPPIKQPRHMPTAHGGC